MLREWQDGFDRMEADTANDVRCRDNVRRLRHTLDFATLKHWNDLARAYPDYFGDYRAVTNRLGKVLPWDKPALDDWEALIKAGGVEKPLPAPFDGMDKALIRRYVPERKGGVPKIVMDPDAAFGYATVVDAPNKPFTFGFYQNDAKVRGPTCTLEPGEIERGQYRVYKLGEIQVTPNSIVWFSSWSWLTQLQLGERLYSPPGPDNDNRYDVHVSLKFDKLVDGYQTAYHTSPPPTNDFSVLCDQIIFVRKPIK